MKKIFIKHMNHPPEHMTTDQVAAAQSYGRILEVSFPTVDASCVFYQGELDYRFEMINQLKSTSVKIMTTTSYSV